MSGLLRRKHRSASAVWRILAYIWCSLYLANAVTLDLDILDEYSSDSEGATLGQPLSAAVNDTVEIQIFPYPDGYNNSELFLMPMAEPFESARFVEGFLKENGTGASNFITYTVPLVMSGLYAFQLLDNDTRKVIVTSPEINISNITGNLSSTILQSQSTSGLGLQTILAISLSLGGIAMLISFTFVVRRLRRKKPASPAVEPFNTVFHAPVLFANEPSRNDPKYLSASSTPSTLIAPDIVPLHGETRDIDPIQTRYMFPLRTNGASIDGPPPDYPDTASGHPIP